MSFLLLRDLLTSCFFPSLLAGHLPFREFTV